MAWWKEQPLARWHAAERQSARRGRRVTGRLVREPPEQATAWFPQLENEPIYSHSYCITSCLLAHCLFGRFFLAFFPLYSHELRNENVEELIPDLASESGGELDVELVSDGREKGRENEKGRRREEWRTSWEKRSQGS